MTVPTRAFRIVAVTDAYLDATMTRREDIVGRVGGTIASGTQAYLTKPTDLRRLLEIFDKFLAVNREAVPASVE